MTDGRTGGPNTLPHLKVAYIHSFATLPATFDELTQEYLPGASTSHFVDSTFYAAEFERGALSPAEEELLLNYVKAAAAADADVAVVTCSFLGTYVDMLSNRATLPWVRVDAAMAREALAVGSRVGVIATAESSLAASTDLLRRLAADAEEDHHIEGRLCDGAFEALAAGDRQRHDDAVRRALTDLQASVDVIVLAQASMAPVAETLQLRVPVLSSPKLCMEALRRTFSRDNASTMTQKGA